MILGPDLCAMMIGTSGQSSGGPTSWQDTFTASPASAGNIGAGGTLRQVVAAASLSASGGYVRVTFKATASENFHMDHCSIIESAGGADGAGAPVELLFSGASGFDISASASIVSDTLAFTLDETKSYLIIMDLNAGHALITYDGSSSGQTIYYKSGTASYNVQNVTEGEYTTSSGYCDGVSKIEVGS